MESLDSALYLRIRPGLSAGERARLEESFGDLKSQTVDVTETVIEIRENKALVRFREKRKLVFKAGRAQELDRNVAMTLTQVSPGTWRIEKLDSR